MKQLWIMGVVGVMSVGTPAQAQTIVQGPVNNPNNGHRYLVVQASNWNQMETFAQSLGGHLATVEDALEDSWINSNLTNGGTRKLFLGLSDALVEGTFVWADGSTSAYRNWRSGQPSSDDYVMTQPGSGGQWDAASSAATGFGVVELSGAIKVPGDYATIQAAIDAAQAGATIEVMPGTYAEALDIAKPVVVKSLGGRAVTTIKSSGPFSAIEFKGGSTLGAIVQGFTIEPGDASGWGVFASASTSSGRLIDCAIRGIFVGLRGPITLNNPLGDLRFENCEISACELLTSDLVKNVASTGARATFINCLIAGNMSAHRYLVQFDAGVITMRNCTLAGNIASLGVRVLNTGVLNLHNCIVRESVASSGTLVASYSNVMGGWAGAGNFDADPLFLAPGNYGLAYNSPCVDAGDLGQYAGLGGGLDLAGQPRAKNDPNVMDTGVGVPPIDIGALEFQPLDPDCPGDFNGDGFVNGDDYDAFAEHFEEGC